MLWSANAKILKNMTFGLTLYEPIKMQYLQ